MIIKRKFRILILFIIIIIISCNKDKNPISSTKEYKTVNIEILNELVSQIENGEYREVHSLLVAKNNTLVFEKYFNGYSRETKHGLYSVTKSFISALIGICLAEGYLDSIEMNIMEFFPEYKDSIANYDSMKEDITVEHLLTMTAGFLWDEWSVSYDNADNDVMKLIQSNDWIKYVLDRPISNSPGTYATYNSGISHLLSAIITKATGKSARDFANDNLFKYLEIEDWYWENRPNGITIGGWGLYLRPIDMLKFGQLYLNKGYWNNKQVISESWIDKSIKPYYQINDWCDYGYQWWRYGQRMVSTGILESTDIYFAAGRGEQFIWVIPAKNAVVVCTAWNDGQINLERALWEYILGALDN